MQKVDHRDYVESERGTVVICRNCNGTKWRVVTPSSDDIDTSTGEVYASPGMPMGNISVKCADCGTHPKGKKIKAVLDRYFAEVNAI